MEICKKRIDEIDMAKGLAILFVFFIHLNEVTGLKWTGSIFADILFTFPECIPILFFICSGYVYQAKGSVLYDSTKRIKQLLIPFVGYGLLVTAVYFIVLINVFGFTALLLLGNLLKEYHFFDIGSQSKKTRMITASVSLIIATIILATNNSANYAFQYGRWGQFKEWSIPISCLGSLSITYLVVFMFHYLKQWKGVADVFRFLGKHTLEILFLHYIIAEIILWINGTWWKIYYDHYPVEKFTWNNWLSVVIGDALILTIYIFIKDKIKKNLLSNRNNNKN